MKRNQVIEKIIKQHKLGTIQGIMENIYNYVSEDPDQVSNSTYTIVEDFVWNIGCTEDQAEEIFYYMERFYSI